MNNFKTQLFAVLILLGFSATVSAQITKDVKSSSAISSDTSINEEGKETLQVMVEPGESFGELPLFDGGVYAATSVANENSVVLRLNKNTFLQLLKDNPEIHFTFSRMLSQRMRFKFMIVSELANHNPEKSISHLFAYFKETQKHICPKCNKVNLTRQQIADMIGLRVETVIRTIRIMHEKGDLLVDKGKVYC